MFLKGEYKRRILVMDGIIQEVAKENIPLNMQKYLNYNEQFKGLEKALSNNFYLEAIFIEYAIMEDRTESILRYEGNEIKAKDGEYISINRKINKIKAIAQTKKSLPQKYFSNELLDMILDWKEERNRFIHALMKRSLTTEELAEFALKGKDRCRLLCNKSNNYKRAVERRDAKKKAQN